MHDFQHQTQPDHEATHKSQAGSSSDLSGHISQNVSQLQAGTPHQNQTIRRQAATRLSQQLGNQAFIRRVVTPSIQRDDPAPAPTTDPAQTGDTTDQGPMSYFSPAFAGHIRTAKSYAITEEANAQEVSSALEMYAAGADALSGQRIQGDGAPDEMKAYGRTARKGLEMAPKLVERATTALDEAKATWYADNPQYND